MKLRDWLSRTNTTQEAFAAKMGVRRETVIRWVAGTNVPDMATIVRIERATEQAVRAQDWAEIVAQRDESAA